MLIERLRTGTRESFLARGTPTMMRWSFDARRERTRAAPLGRTERKMSDGTIDTNRGEGVAFWVVGGILLLVMPALNSCRRKIPGFISPISA